MTGDPGLPASTWCFAESANRVVVAVAPADLDEVLERARDAGVPARECGRTGGDRLRIDGGVDVAVSELAEAWSNAIPRAVAGDVVPSS